ncbi:RnfABCDGE type electron transport complex subunit D [bacterium]|nr:RnfABCDGE type electron transport complex subunit D [bacterium]
MNFLIDRFREIIEFFDRKFENTKLNDPWGTISTFFFSLKTVNPLAGPHIRDNTDLKRYMSAVMGAAAPTVLASIYFFGWRSLALVIFCYVLGIIIEMGFATAKGEEVTEGMFVTCILYPMILPPTIPFWMAGVGLAVGLILGKEVFGGTGKNIFNPAIVGRVFLAVTFPVHMASRWVTPYGGFPGGFLHWVKSGDAVTAASPLIDFKNGTASNITDMLIGSTSGSLGETSAILIIIGGLFLLYTRIANWRLTLSTIVSAMVLAALMHAANPTAFASPLFHLAGGGLLFGAFYMVTDPVSSPFTSIGKWIYGGLIGAVTIVIRNLSGFPEGMMFAILLLNMFAPVIDDAVLAMKYKKAGGA